MKLTVYIVDSTRIKPPYDTPKDIAIEAQAKGNYIEHKIEAICGQDNKARLLNNDSVTLMAAGSFLSFLMEEDIPRSFGWERFSVAYEFNGKWGKL